MSSDDKGRLILQPTSLRAQRAFIFAVVQTIEALAGVETGLNEAFLDEAFLEILKRNIDYLTRTGLFPESHESDRLQVLLLHDYLLALRHRIIEHVSSQTPEQRDQVLSNRAVWEQMLDTLADAEEDSG